MLHLLNFGQLTTVCEQGQQLIKSNKMYRSVTLCCTMHFSAFFQTFPISVNICIIACSSQLNLCL